MELKIATEKEPIIEKVQTSKKSDYYCNKCNFTCRKMSGWLRHVSTIKHNKTLTEYEKPLFKCNCGKQYSDRSGLWKHAKKCEFILVSEEPVALKETPPDLLQVLDSEKKELKLLILELMKKINTVK